jgi:hypothetical protein
LHGRQGVAVGVGDEIPALEATTLRLQHASADKLNALAPG